ncbi:biotin/lipoyl-binding protein [Paenibacillus alvei]|uniref:biotin/lipoyl-binding protein n=1 Tax=Paenibacillus alvei TaxID=44250 RepID=UPI0013DBDD28|nr:biotin/lipoyl-binding protein [Paenibacillus alvei]
MSVAGLQEDNHDRKRKQVVKRISILFIVVLAVLTLFSNTFESLMLPKVITEKAVSGSLDHKLVGGGILRPILEVKLMNPAGWKISKVLVKEGAQVRKGQTLVTYDSITAERELQDEKANLEKQHIELQTIQDQFIASSTVDRDEMKLRSASRDIHTRKLDIEIQTRKVNERSRQLAKQNRIAAPFDGIVTKIHAVEGLASAGEPDVVVSNSSGGYFFELTMDTARLTNLSLTIGDIVQTEVQVTQQTKKQSRQLDATITEIKDTAVRSSDPVAAGSSAGEISVPQVYKIVRLKIIDKSLRGGEEARITLMKRSHQEGIIISNQAIHRDREGTYVYVVDEQMGLLGNVFTVRKALVTILESNDKVTLVQPDSIYEQELIIMNSSEPIQNGNRVRLQ